MANFAVPQNAITPDFAVNSRQFRGKILEFRGKMLEFRGNFVANDQNIAVKCRVLHHSFTIILIKAKNIQILSFINEFTLVS